ncbi:hypothetical protein C8R44DRAFT_992833 [Mycena epipterygia]|nr:hypothetical protein C8R44DRAFT_992833 [Mycena epipterygia]
MGLERAVGGDADAEPATSNPRSWRLNRPRPNVRAAYTLHPPAAITPYVNGGQGKRQSAPHATAHQKPSDADIAATHQMTMGEYASDTRPAPPNHNTAGQWVGRKKAKYVRQLSHPKTPLHASINAAPRTTVGEHAHNIHPPPPPAG